MIQRIHLIKLIVVSTAVMLIVFIVEIFSVKKNVYVNYDIYAAYNDSIIMRNYEFSKQNPYGFTDIDRPAEKPDTVFRIAVLGDSYIWGDGIPFEEVWSHRLADSINSKYKNIELFSWGIRGWSTLDQYNFFKKEGRKYDIDLLLFGFCHNDPDMGDYRQMSPEWYKRLNFLIKVFPKTTLRILDNLYKRSYARWLVKLYSEKNLRKYSDLLQVIKTFEEKDVSNIAFVLTPSNLNETYEERYMKIEELLNHAKIDCINLYPAMYQKFAHADIDTLKANPVNGHPGLLLNIFYAEEAMKYLLEKNYIDSIYLKSVL